MQELLILVIIILVFYEYKELFIKNEREMMATIKDVAKRAGVSPSTVSRTLKDNQAISEETKVKVRAAMDDLGNWEMK